MARMGKNQKVNNENEIKFHINNIECLKIILPCSLDEIFRYHSILIEHHGNDKKYILFDDFAIYGLGELLDSITMALNNKLKLHESLKNKEIGYLWNEIFSENPTQLVYEKGKPSDGRDFWVGEKYLVWCSNKGRTSTWLYQKNNKTILEVTPDFEWNPKISDKKNEKMYSEFLKNYKPLVVTEISKKTAKEWLKQAEELIEIIKANDSKYFIKKNSEDS